MKKLIRRFVSDEQGLESVEYAVLGSLIVLAIIGAVLALGGTIEGVFEDINTGITNAP